MPRVAGRMNARFQLPPRIPHVPNPRPDMGKVAAFWHRIARESFVSHADAATLDMFEGITIRQLNDALYHFDSAGERVSK